MASELPALFVCSTYVQARNVGQEFPTDFVAVVGKTNIAGLRYRAIYDRRYDDILTPERYDKEQEYMDYAQTGLVES